MTNHGTHRLSVRKDTFTGLWIVYATDGHMARVCNTQPDATRWADSIAREIQHTVAWRQQ